MKYIILAYSNDETFDIPRQLVEINGESLVQRTIRLLKENGVKDILITAKDKKFDNLGVTKYESSNNDFDYIKRTGYWLNAFPIELLNEPVCFIWGDVYFSENAIKTIVKTPTESTLFFCTYQNKNIKYIKEHDEPLAYKVVDYELFKNKIEETKKLKDKGICCREPIVWELYRVINGIYVNDHKMTDNYIVINDESCDIDDKKDLEKLKSIIEGDKNMIKAEVIKEFDYNKFEDIKDSIIRKNTNKNKYGKLYVGDVFECDEETAKYLTGENSKKAVVIKIVEVLPEIEKETFEYTYSEDIKPKIKKTTKKKKTSKE